MSMMKAMQHKVESSPMMSRQPQTNSTDETKCISASAFITSSSAGPAVSPRRDKRHIFRRDGRIHADADEEHRQNTDGHQPVQEALKHGKTFAGAGHRSPPPAASEWYG